MLGAEGKTRGYALPGVEESGDPESLPAYLAMFGDTLLRSRSSLPPKGPPLFADSGDLRPLVWLTDRVTSKITPTEITESIVDDLVMGFDDRSPSIRVTRTGPGSLDLDYGQAGRFRLVVEELFQPASN